MTVVVVLGRVVALDQPAFAGTVFGFDTVHLDELLGGGQVAK